MAASLADLEARGHGEQLREHTERLRALDDKLDDTNTRVRSIEGNLAEMRDMLVRALDRPGSG